MMIKKEEKIKSIRGKINKKNAFIISLLEARRSYKNDQENSKTGFFLKKKKNSMEHYLVKLREYGFVLWYMD